MMPTSRPMTSGFEPTSSSAAQDTVVVMVLATRVTRSQMLPGSIPDVQSVPVGILEQGTYQRIDDTFLQTITPGLKESR